nr:hypothetical protein [Tanacetum cinerariifolium]
APVVRNLARQKFIAQFIIALLKSRNVQFGEVAQHLNDAVKVASNETRIQDFFRETDLNYALASASPPYLAQRPAAGRRRVGADPGAGSPICPVSGRRRVGPGLGQSPGRQRLPVSLWQRRLALYGPTLCQALDD